jgi:Ca-activated chloride channel homolog
MSFLSLSAFWFALTIPIVILFYLLKRRRKIHLVSSTVLWQRFLTESQANAPFQKLRRNLLLFLQILLLLLAVLALARPYFSSQLSGGALQVLVLDASASMQSMDVSPSRFHAAKEKALELVDGLRDSDQMVLVVAGSRTEVIQSPTSEKSILRRAIQSIDATDGPTRLLEAMQLSETLVRDHPSSEIHLLTDGAVSDLGDLDESDLNLQFHQIGSRGNNVGVVSMDVRPNPEDPTTRAVFSNIVNFSTNDFRFAAELKLDERMIETRSVSLEGGSSMSLAFITRQTTNGVFTLSLGLDDDLAVDNEVQVVSLLAQPAKTLLYTPGNSFLEKALLSAGDLELEVTADIGLNSTDFDVVILDGLQPLTWPEGNVMAINLVHTNWFTSWETVKAPTIVDWKSAHPLLRFVIFDDVEIADAYAVRSPFWGESLVESSRSPLLIAGEQGGQRRLWVGFDTIRSTWPLRVSFPMFMANAVRWLNPSLSKGRELNVQTGKPIQVGFESDKELVSVTGPNGQVEEVVHNPESKSFVYGNTLRSGLYRVGEAKDGFYFSANLLDSAESDTAPRTTLAFEGGRQVTATLKTRADLEIWRWIALSALAVLMFEWWYFHKRTV